MKKITLVVFSFFIIHHATSQTAQIDKQRCVDFHREWTGLSIEYPEDQSVMVISFNLGSDDVEELFLADNDPIHSGRNGEHWFVYYKKNNLWNPVKLKMIDSITVDSISSIYNRFGDFHALKEENKPDRLIVIYTSYSKNGDGTSTETVSTSEITIDSEGYLLNTPMTNLTDLLNDPLVPRQLVKLIPETFTEVPAYKPRLPESGISTNQTVVVEEVPVLKSGTTEK